MHSSTLSYFTDPLTWIGIILMFVFLLIRYILHKDIITQLPAWLNSGLPRKILKHGFLLGILVIILGISIKYQERNEAEQSHAINLVKIEISTNLSVIEQLEKNIQTLVDSHQHVSDALRSSDSEIMNGLLSIQKPSSGKTINFSKAVDASFTTFKESNLLKNKAAMNAFNQSKDLIKSKIYPHNQALLSMQDQKRQQYPIQIQIWQDHKALMSRVDEFDQQVFENNLATMLELRKRYDRTLRDVDGFFTEALNFMARNTFIGNGAVFEILTKEDKSFRSLNAMHSEIKAKLQALKRQRPF